MQESMNEKISLLIDDELASDKALSLLKSIKNDSELQQCLQRYQLIAQAMKNEPCFLTNADFSVKIKQQIQNEPILFVPQAMPAQKSEPRWQKIGMAVAASLVLVTVWVAHKAETRNPVYSLQPAVAYSVAVPPVNMAAKYNDRFNDYLLAHDNSGYSPNIPPAQTYARVVGYQR